MDDGLVAILKEDHDRLDAAVAAVTGMGMLLRAVGPLSSTAIAASFRQGRRILPQVEAVLAALVWDGCVSQAEGNAGFVLRRAA